MASSVSPSREKVAQLSRSLKIIAEANRMRILCLLMQGEVCGCEFAERLGIPQNLASHHLRVLREQGLVSAQRDESDKRWIYYSINRESLRRLNALYRSFFWENRVGPWSTCCGPEMNCCSFGPEGRGCPN